MARGRHRKPTNTKRNLQRAALIGAGVGAPLAFASSAFADEIVVQSGDTVSEIAIEKLGMSEWQSLCEENRDVTGGNCDLIFPGQTLHFADGLLMPNGAPTVVAEPPAAPEQTVQDPAPEVQVGASAVITNSAGPVQPQAQRGADAVFNNVPGAQLITIGGTRASAIDPHGHPAGKALDFMVLGDTPLGNAIVDYNIAHWDELGIEYIIWQQRILMSPGGSWEWMEDRGSVTANHYDHVHVNYN